MTTSSEERNVEMARKGYRAFNEGHIDEAMATIHDEILWHNGGDNPLTGDFRGKEAVMEMLAKFGQLMEGSYEADIHDILASEEHTAVIGTYTATRHGRTHSARFVDVVHPAADGRAKEFWRFVEDQAAEDEFLKE
ncbi:MAG TPA: nuclear transport factor 2 family protein [Candidatus Dormibacteraeota bacterium]|nr:nuclear transport factor 2 family protein [Candidatus Dormibacteraeota bacterium]